MQRTDINNALPLIKHPAKIALAVCKKPDGKFNAITLEWFMRTSINPLIFAISIGHTRYSYECLQNTGHFNLVIPSRKMRDFTVLCGSKSGRDIDKFEHCEHSTFAGRLAKLPIVRDALCNLECEIVTQVRTGDHTIFAGEVKYAWIDSEQEILLVEHL